MLEHIPVLLNEVISLLSPKKYGVYFDGTFGGGGYTRAILESEDCKVIACDRDKFVESIADDFTKQYKERFDFSHAKFSDVASILENKNIEKVDGIILDLGVSSFQLSDSSRGFSFRLTGPLDMSMGLCDENAMEVIRKYSEKDLADIIYKFGEEHFSRRIAKNIKMNLNKINNTEDLANIVRSCIKRTGKTDPSTKTFQALRIFVNKELDELENLLSSSVDLLNPGGKIIVVSFHSLEDRIVKLFFRGLSIKKDISNFSILTKKPITPTKEECLANPKSRSAKLRGICML